MDLEKYIGKDRDGELFFVELKENSTIIKGFNGYIETVLSNDDVVFENTSWLHDVTLKGGRHLRSGDKFDPSDLRVYTGKAKYESNVVCCDECGEVFDTEDTENYTIDDNASTHCLGCITGDEMLIPIETVQDIFRSRDLKGLKVSNDYKEICTFFVDSSGMGGDHEPAMMITEFEKKVQGLISSTKKPLYAALTGIGQFQVYITFYILNN